MPEPLAELGELRAFGDESPSDPGGVGPRRDQCRLERGEIEIRTPARPSAATGVEADRLVGLADEHRCSLCGGVQGDRPQLEAGGDP